MLSDSLLETKLHIPTPRPGLVRRPRLLDRMDAGLERKLTLLSAPAGFGKTTLLSEWIANLRVARADSRGTAARSPNEDQKPDLQQRVAWVSLDEGDNDPVRFWSYVIAALARLQPGLGKDARALLHSPQPPPSEAVLTALINELAVLRPPAGLPRGSYVLVLDDYHTIEARPIHHGMAFLLEYLPAQMRVVVSSRADPPLPLPRLRAEGQLLELRVEDLRFTSDEAAAFLNQVMGLDLSAADVAALEARTEGWIAGLQLAALSVQGRDPEQTADFIETFSGTHRYILDYLLQEVLGRQTEEIQSFLLQTSILKRLTAPLCDAVCFSGAEIPSSARGTALVGELGSRESEVGDSQRETPSRRSPSQEILEQLEAANLFIVPLDDDRRWYRYHRLFADLLHARLQEREPTAPLHRRAAAWHAHNGSVVEAVDHALFARDFDRAGDLIVQRVDEMLWTRGEVATILGWLERLPEASLKVRPNLCLVHAWALLISVELAAAEGRLHDAQRALETASPSKEERKAALGQMAVIEAMLANFRGDIPRTIELSRKALEEVPEQHLLLRASLAGNLGGAYSASGDLPAACAAFGQSVRLYRQAGSRFAALIAASYQISTLAALGRLKEALRIHQEVLGPVAAPHADESLGAGLAHVALGNVLYERNELEAAAQHLHQGLDPREQQRDAHLGPGQHLLIDGYLGLARVLEAQGDREGALDMLQEAEELAAAFAPYLRSQVAAARARLWIRQGRLVAAARWAQERGLRADDRPDYGLEYEHLTLARVLTGQGKLGDALSLLEGICHMARAGQREATVLECLILQFLALEAMGKRHKALVTLEEALLLAEPEGFVRTFADEGPAMAELLEVYGRRRSATSGQRPARRTLPG